MADAGFRDVEVVASGRRNGGTYEMELLARPDTDFFPNAAATTDIDTTADDRGATT